MPEPTDPQSPISPLPSDVRALLEAVLEAVDLPMADSIEDHRSWAILLDCRASDAKIMLNAVLRDDGVAAVTNQLRSWIAQRPVTYTVYQPDEQAEAYRAGQLAELRHQVRDPAVPPPAVYVPPFDDEMAAVTPAAAESAEAVL